jgi:hypothetical protein
MILGSAIAQAVSRRLPTAAALFRFHVRSCGICGGQSGNGEGFLRELRFSLLIHIPPTASYSSVIRGWYRRPTSGWRTKWTQSYPTPRIKLINDFGCIDFILLHAEPHIMSYSMQRSHFLVLPLLLVKGILVYNRVYMHFLYSCPQRVKQRQRPLLYVSQFSTVLSLGMTEWYLK